MKINKNQKFKSLFLKILILLVGFLGGGGSFFCFVWFLDLFFLGFVFFINFLCSLKKCQRNS